MITGNIPFTHRPAQDERGPMSCSWVSGLLRVNLFLQAWDGLATYYGLSHGVQEGNPLLRSCIEYWGVSVTLVGA